MFPFVLRRNGYFDHAHLPATKRRLSVTWSALGMPRDVSMSYTRNGMRSRSFSLCNGWLRSGSESRSWRNDA